jgi:hypothetical protein
MRNHDLKIHFWGRRNSKSANENGGEQKIMMKQSHFRITKSMIIDYSRFCGLSDDPRITRILGLYFILEAETQVIHATAENRLSAGATAGIPLSGAC